MCLAERTVGRSPGPATHHPADFGQAPLDGAGLCSGKEWDETLLPYKPVRGQESDRLHVLTWWMIF